MRAHPHQSTFEVADQPGRRTSPGRCAAGGRLAGILRDEATTAGLPLVVNQLGAAAYGFLSSAPVDTYPDAAWADAEGYRQFAGALLDAGIHVIPWGLLYVSSEHTDADLDLTRDAVRRAAAQTADRLDGPLAAGVPGAADDATAGV